MPIKHSAIAACIAAIVAVAVLAGPAGARPADLRPAPAATAAFRLPPLPRLQSFAERMLPPRRVRAAVPYYQRAKRTLELRNTAQQQIRTACAYLYQLFDTSWRQYEIVDTAYDVCEFYGYYDG
jgi:hypothetical protein